MLGILILRDRGVYSIVAWDNLQRVVLLRSYSTADTFLPADGVGGIPEKFG
jgi:hypothetical protein